MAGQVKSPGAYAVDPGATVLQVLSLAGGLTDRGSDNRIRIQRTENGKKVEVSAKLTDVVKPGDTIIVRDWDSGESGSASCAATMGLIPANAGMLR